MKIRAGDNTTALDTRPQYDTLTTQVRSCSLNLTPVLQPHPQTLSWMGLLRLRAEQ
jgi:hypothetical protein